MDHKPLHQILSTRVKGGRVDYAGIRNHAATRARLNSYVAAVGQAKVGGMGRKARLAFYLNAYNALVLKAVVDRWPLANVTKVPGFFKRLRHKVAGRLVTLDQLENKIIRPQFKEPRIHFALVCAARSCPPLASAAFGAANLEPMLERLARSFINSHRGVQVRGGAVKVSKLFNWYAADFAAASGSVGKYLARYHKRHATRLTGGKLDYLHYDWSINKK